MRQHFHYTSELEAKILQRVRAVNGVSRVELARAFKLAPATAGFYVERLISDGFLAESQKAERETGRPPMMLNLNSEAGEFVGVDFEARNIMAVAVDFSDKPLRNAHTLIGEDDSVDTVIAKIVQTITRVQPADPQRLLAIGVGVPGVVNSGEGVAIHYNYIPNWNNIPLAKSLRTEFGVPVYIENNARSMALAELWFGQGQGIADLLCIGIRSGIAAGMILDGRLYRGAHHRGGEIGSWPCPLVTGKIARWFAGGGESSLHGPELQEIASVRAIQRALQNAISAGEKTVLQGRPNPIALEELVRAVQQRDPLAVRIVNEAARCLGWAIAQLLMAVDPKKIVLAGPLTSLGEHLLGPLRATVDTIVPREDGRTTEIVASAMGEFSGALGATALAVHQWKPAYWRAASVARGKTRAGQGGGVAARRR